MKYARDKASGVGRFLRGELGAKDSRKVQGAVHHIHAVSEMLRRNAGAKLKNIEFPVKITTRIQGFVKKIGGRVYDAVVNVDGVNIHIDAKSIKPGVNGSQAVRFLRAEMRNLKGGEDKPGKLFRDIVEMYNRRFDDTFKVEWHYDKRSRGLESKYLEAIKDELRNGRGGEELRNVLGFAGNDDGWGLALREIFGKLDEGFIKVVTE